MMSHQSAAEFHNRYPYSGKIICEEHGTSFHRQVLKSSKGEKEVWQCRVYRNRGRAACSAPQMRTSELDQIMAQIFEQLAKDKSAIVDAVMKVIQAVPNEHDYRQDVKRVEAEIDSICAKKDRLLEMSIEGALSTAEFKQQQRYLQPADPRTGAASGDFEGRRKKKARSLWSSLGRSRLRWRRNCPFKTV